MLPRYITATRSEMCCTTERCRKEMPKVYTTKTGHYSKCHYSADEAFVRANAPETSRTKAQRIVELKGDM